MEEDKLTCKFLFFAEAAEAAGMREQSVVIDCGSTIADVFAKLSANSQALHRLQQSCVFALDEKLVHTDTEVTNGCTIAMLPPVSGG